MLPVEMVTSLLCTAGLMAGVGPNLWNVLVADSMTGVQHCCFKISVALGWLGR